MATSRPIVVEDLRPLERGEPASDEPRFEVVHQVVAEHPARIGEAVRHRLRLRVEKDPGRLHGTSAEHDHFRLRLVSPPGPGVDELDPAGLARVPVEQYPVHRCPRPQREIAPSEQRRDDRIECRKPGCGRTAVVAGPTEVAGRSGRSRLHQHCPANRDHRDADLLAPAGEGDLPTAEWRRGCVVVPVGSHRQSFARSKDPHQLLCPVIVRGEVRVADRPILARPILHRLGLEVPLGHPQGDPCPGVRSPTNRVDSRPMKIGPGARCVAVDARMHVEVLRIRTHLPEAVILPGLAEPPPRHLVGPSVLGVKDLRPVPFGTNLQQKNP